MLLIPTTAQASGVEILNASTQISNYQVSKMGSIANSYLSLVARKWGVTPLPMRVYLVDEFPQEALASMQEGTIAFHWYDSGPYAYVKITNYKESVVDMTHEIAEMVMNPFYDKIVKHGKYKYHLEIADVTSMEFKMYGVSVSDFSLPSYWQTHGVRPYTFKNNLSYSFDISQNQNRELRRR